jgi:hypothetical protein
VKRSCSGSANVTVACQTGVSLGNFTAGAGICWVPSPWALPSRNCRVAFARMECTRVLG